MIADGRIELQHLPVAITSPTGAPATAPAIVLEAVPPEDRELRETLAASVARHRGNLAPSRASSAGTARRSAAG